MYPMAIKKCTWKPRSFADETMVLKIDAANDIRRDLWVVLFMLLQLFSVATVGDDAPLLKVQGRVLEILQGTWDWEKVSDEDKRKNEAELYDQFGKTWNDLIQDMRAARMTVSKQTIDTCASMYSLGGGTYEDHGKDARSVSIRDYVNRFATRFMLATFRCIALSATTTNGSALETVKIKIQEMIGKGEFIDHFTMPFNDAKGETTTFPIGDDGWFSTASDELLKCLDASLTAMSQAQVQATIYSNARTTQSNLRSVQADPRPKSVRFG